MSFYTSTVTTFGDANYRTPRVGLFTPADLRALGPGWPAFLPRSASAS